MLFDHLPVDERLDIGVVGIDDHHLGRAAGGAAGFDRTRCPVADFQEPHQAGRPPAAGQLFAFAAKRRKVGAGAGPVFEQPRLAHPQVHDAAVIDQIIGAGLDETGVRLRVFIGRQRFGQHAGLVVDIMVPLRRAVDAVSPMQAGVEPLGRVRRAHLGRQRVTHLVVIGLRVRFGAEIATLPAPIGPGPGQPVKHLLGARLAAHRGPGSGHAAPQEFGHALFLDPFDDGRHARFAEIFLRDDIGCDLRPARRHFAIIQFEHDRAIRIANL